MIDGGPSISAPVQEEVRRFSVGTVLSRGWSVWISNLPLFLGVSLACHLPLLLFVPRGWAAPDAKLLEALSGLVQPLLSAFVSGVVIRGVFEQLRGGRATFADSLQVAVRSFWRILWTTFVAEIVVVLFSFLLIVPGIMKACSYFVAVPAAVVEGTSASESLARSTKLTEGYRWHAFALFLVFGGVAVALSLIVGAVAFPTPAAVQSFVRSPSLALAFAANVVPNAIAGSLYAVFSGVAYYQLRVVKEGIDIEQLAAVFD
jgi:hypothetical protein